MNSKLKKDDLVKRVDGVHADKTAKVINPNQTVGDGDSKLHGFVEIMFEDDKVDTYIYPKEALKLA